MCMALPALLRMWLAFLCPPDMTLVATAATAAPAATPMPMPLDRVHRLFVHRVKPPNHYHTFDQPQDCCHFHGSRVPPGYAGPREKNSPPGAWA